MHAVNSTVDVGLPTLLMGAFRVSGMDSYPSF